MSLNSLKEVKIGNLTARLPIPGRHGSRNITVRPCIGSGK